MSPLVLRDIDILKKAKSFEVGLSVPTSDDEIRKLFEPYVPSIQERIRALEELHRVGIKTYAMIAPMLPGAERLMENLAGKVDYILVDRMNYHYGDSIYRDHGMEGFLSDLYCEESSRHILSECRKKGIICAVVFLL
jgi:DNA repair photolyase